jgi:hypothetical protein
MLLAHMAVEGAGQIASGALHPLITPAHALILLGLGLLVGQQVPLDLRVPIRVFAPVSAAALFLTMFWQVATVYQPVLVGIALCVGILVGLERKLSRLACGVLCAAAAFGIGTDSAVESGSNFVVIKTLIGTWLGMNVAVVYIAICASNGAGRKWSRAAIRIVGSWIIAISMLVLAFSLRK